MHIIKGQTRRFQDYEVFRILIQEQTPKNLWQAFVWDFIHKRRPTEQIEIKIDGVVEANDQTGLLAVQEKDLAGNLLYSNGVDNIATDGAVKVLLLAPIFRQTFLQAGFRPKLSVTYGNNLRISYNGPTQAILINEEKVKETKREKVEV